MHFLMVDLSLGREDPERDLRDSCIQHNVSLAESNGHTVQVVRDGDLPGGRVSPPFAQAPMPLKLILMSGFIRFRIASKTPDLLYLDTDLKLLTMPEFNETGKPYFAEDICMFYVNDCCDFFKKYPRFICFQDETFVIDPGCYEHKGATAKELLKGTEYASD